jgi:hypothetical protein
MSIMPDRTEGVEFVANWATATFTGLRPAQRSAIAVRAAASPHRSWRPVRARPGRRRRNGWAEARAIAHEQRGVDFELELERGD